jgi:catechol 2,3-dioxygenase-like lactoylglutathione lyase family enzyme
MLAEHDVLTLIPITDGDRALAFYKDTLGLDFVADDGFALAFAVNGRWLRLTRVQGSFTPQPFALMAWMVDDMPERVGQLTQRGVVFQRYAGLEQDELGVWQVPGKDAQVAWFHDPDGNLLSLVQSTPRRP